MEENSQKNHVVNHFEAGSNCQVFNGDVTGCVFAMPGSNVTSAQPSALPEPKEAQREADVPLLVTCVAMVRAYFWKDSAMAVIFCVCRDRYHYTDNMSQFERDFQCQEGLLSNTFRNNPFMRLHIDKWKENGAKERVLRLVEAYEKAVEEQRKE